MHVLEPFLQAGFLYPANTHHGIEHHQEVLSIFFDIYPNSSSLKENWTITQELIAIHDGLDHKYPALHEHNLTVLREMHKEYLIEMAKKMSWSKRTLYKEEELEEVVKIARYCDWITAIHLPRCKDFAREANPELCEEEINKLVLAHAKEKLIHILEALPEPFHSYAMPKHEKLIQDITTLS